MGNKPIDFAFDQEFKEQVDFFKNKVRLPTKKYSDMLGAAHSKAFVVAGATKDAILCDFQQELLKAQRSGTSLQDFKDSFNAIVKKHGWKHKGSAGWRSRVIFEANMRTSYQAGRYKQMTDPDVLALRPFWEYRHGASRVPRQEHLHWNGLVLPADSPWWSTHYPPNGWGCSCYVVSRSARDLKREDKSVDKAPALDIQEKTIGRGDEARVVKVPKGIDPGWDYNPGQAAYGQINTNRSSNHIKRKIINDNNPEDYGLNKDLTATVTSESRLHKDINSISKAIKVTEAEIGEESVFTFKTNGFEYPVYVNAKNLVEHKVSQPERARYAGFIKELIENPSETWMAFEEYESTGKVQLVLRFIKEFKFENKTRGIVLVAKAVNSRFEVLTMIPSSNKKYINKNRRGKYLPTKNS